MILSTIIAAEAKAVIAADTTNFGGISPHLGKIIDAVASATANAVNTEIATIKLSYNLHTHVTAVGASAPPVPPLT